MPANIMSPAWPKYMSFRVPKMLTVSNRHVSCWHISTMSEKNYFKLYFLEKKNQPISTSFGMTVVGQWNFFLIFPLFIASFMIGGRSHYRVSIQSICRPFPSSLLRAWSCLGEVSQDHHPFHTPPDFSNLQRNSHSSIKSMYIVAGWDNQ